MSDGNRSSLSYLVESTWDEDPGSALDLENLPFTKDSLAPNKQSEISQEVRSDRNIQDMVMTGLDSAGDVEFEITDYAKWFDDFLEAALMADSTTSSNDVALADTYSVADDATYPNSQSDFTLGSSDAPAIGRAVLFNGLFSGSGLQPAIVVERPDDDTFSVRPNMGDTGVIEAAATYESIEMKNGTTRKSFFIEKRFEDLSGDKNIAFGGMMVNTMELNFVSRQILTGKINFIGGRSWKTSDYTVNSRATTSGNVLSASANVGAIFIDGAPARLKSANVTINNEVRGQDEIGTPYFGGIGVGWCQCTIQTEAYLDDLSLFNKLLDDSNISVILSATRPEFALSLYFPNCKIPVGATPTVEGVNTDVMLPLQLQAIYDSTEAATVVASVGRVIT